MGRLPPLPGRGRGRSTSCRRPAPRGSPTASSCRPTRRACAPGARATSRCTSPTTTPTARRPCSHACPTHIDIPAYMAALGRRRRGRRRRDHRARGAALPRHPRPGLPALLRAGLPARRRGRAHRHLRPAPGGGRSLPGPADGRAARPASGWPSSAPARPAWRRLVPHGGGPPGHDLRRQRQAGRRCCATASPSSGCPRPIARQGARAALGGGRPLRRRVRAGLRDRPATACSTPGSTPCSSASAPGRAGTRTSPGPSRRSSGLRFLRDIRAGHKPRIARQVAVIGDGITALDAARTARRLGAKRRHGDRPS